MSVVVTCPQCQAGFEIPGDLADQPVRCHRCAHTFQANGVPAHLDGIRVGASATLPRRQIDEVDHEPMPSPRRPTARAPFPWGPIAVITIGILFFLLSLSAGFNFYYLSDPDGPHRNLEEARQAERVAVERRLQAEKLAALALQQEVEAKARMDRLLRELEEARKPIEDGDAAPLEWGTLEGRVTFKGELPELKSLELEIQRHADAKPILAGASKDDLLDPTWRIDPKTKGVANVCVFLKRPANKILPIHADDKNRKTPIVVDAPFSFFKPHMVAFYPEWFDGQNHGKTGEKFVTKNSSSINHCFKAVSVPDGAISYTLAPGKEVELNLTPQALPIHCTCTLRKWSSGYVWVFDHPYYAITKADGTFTIPRVPANMEAQVMAWHESQGWLLTKDGRSMPLKKGKNVLNFDMSTK